MIARKNDDQADDQQASTRLHCPVTMLQRDTLHTITILHQHC